MATEGITIGGWGNSPAKAGRIEIVDMEIVIVAGTSESTPQRTLNAHLLLGAVRIVRAETSA